MAYIINPDSISTERALAQLRCYRAIRDDVDRAQPSRDLAAYYAEKYATLLLQRGVELPAVLLEDIPGTQHLCGPARVQS